MARSTRRATTSLGVLLLGLAAAGGLLLAGPAGAQTSGPGTSGGARATNDSVASGTCVAVNDSVCSGSGTAANDSTASGSAVAVDGSVSSGCATAVNDSTASGAPCPPATTATTRPPAPGGGGGGTGGGGTTAARPATPSAATAGRTLALTGSSTGPLALTGALVVLAGALLVKAARDGDPARTA
jgi:hypothetical protein